MHFVFSRARMLMRRKISMHVETVILLSKVHETKHIISCNFDSEIDIKYSKHKIRW